MNKIEARILYNEIRETGVDDGLYVWADPDEAGVLSIQRLMHGAPFKLANSTEYHSTVLFHKGSLPEGIEPPADRPMKARVSKIDIWTDHKGRRIAVLLLVSPDLQKLHQELLGLSLTHSFDDYAAHITVGKEVQDDRLTTVWLAARNAYLQEKPLTIAFDPKLKASSLA